MSYNIEQEKMEQLRCDYEVADTSEAAGGYIGALTEWPKHSSKAVDDAMGVMTLRLRNKDAWISIPYEHVQEIEWSEKSHCLVNGRAVIADGPTLTEELRNARRNQAPAD